MNDPKRKNVVIICGSESDLPQVKPVYWGHRLKERIIVHVMSCHRNPQELMNFVFNFLQEGDVAICIGSKALALPGVIDAWAHHFKINVRVAGVALGEPGSNALLAAQLSIEELPGQPVIINEATGHAYTGYLGLIDLLDCIESGGLPPAKPRKEKPVQMDVLRKEEPAQTKS